MVEWCLVGIVTIVLSLTCTQILPGGVLSFTTGFIVEKNIINIYYHEY
eukprot:SAG11_NODE_1516_length_4766_cov_1.916006_9_plen_48_part_00